MKRIITIILVMFVVGLGIAGCGGGGDSGGETESSDVGAVWTGDTTFGAMMVHVDGEMLLPITTSDDEGNITDVTGVMWNDASGLAVAVYLDDDLLPSETMIGGYILQYFNWDLEAGTVDIVLLYPPTGYIEVFNDVALSAAYLSLATDLKHVAMGKMICLPKCENNAQNLADLLSIAGSSIGLGLCVAGTAASLGAAAIPCAGFLIAAAPLILPSDWWLDSYGALGDVMTGNSLLGCASYATIASCINGVLGLGGRIFGIIGEERDNSSDIRAEGASIFPENPDHPSGVVVEGGGLPSCPGIAVCVPGTYMPCWEGVKQCESDCTWGSCDLSYCGDGICDADADEDSTSCPSDCAPSDELSGTWSGSYTATGPGDGGCTYSNGGSMTMTLSRDESSFSGSSYIDGIQLRYIPGCDVAWYTSSNGSCSGSITDATMTGHCAYYVADTGGTFNLYWDATISGNTMSGTFTGDDSGSFTLTK